MKTKDWQRAGFEVNGDKLERIENGTTHVRADRKTRGRVNIHADVAGQVVELERDTRDGALAALQIQKRIGERFLIRIKTIRKRLLDEDNLCCKYVVDLCRYAGILPTDAPGTAKIEVSQQKADKGAREEVKIEIYRL